VLAKLADEADPETSPLFLPYLLPGEQGARWDPGLAGALSGLHLGHGAGGLPRGLRNGIMAESSHCLAVLEAAAGADGQLVAVHHDEERAGLAPDRSRSAWWERQAERHESAVAGQIVSR
jgi:xylulokinase